MRITIRNEADHIQALELVEALLDRAEDSPDDPLNPIIEMLSDAITEYEDQDPELLAIGQDPAEVTSAHALCGTLDPQRVATAALQSFFTITGQWGLGDAEQRTLLGDPPEDIFFQWKTEHTASQLDPDTLKRISYILGIHKALCILLPSRRAAFEWVKKPNDAPLFQGQTALSRLLTGRMEDLHQVRAYLDGECGDTMEMEHRNFRAVVVIDFDEQDQCYHGHVANFPGIWPFHGATINELRQAFEQVVDDYYEANPMFAGMITEADHQAKRDRQAAFARWFDENPDREVPRSKRFENCRIEPSAELKAKEDAFDEAMRAFDRTCEKFDNALRELAK